MFQQKKLKKHLLLIAGDTSEYNDFLNSLKNENYHIKHISKISDALDYIWDEFPDVIIVDTNKTNEMSALELSYVIKSNIKFAETRYIIVSDRSLESSEVSAFRAGADDYVVKPVYTQALIERVKTRLHQPKDVITVQAESNGHSPIHIDRESYSVHVGNHPLALSRKEFELLYLMASHPGKIFKRDELFEKIWNRKYSVRDRTVDVHILHLRRKLGDSFIQTQKGVGYRFSS